MLGPCSGPPEPTFLCLLQEAPARPGRRSCLFLPWSPQDIFLASCPSLGHPAEAPQGNHLSWPGPPPIPPLGFPILGPSKPDHPALSPHPTRYSNPVPSRQHPRPPSPLQSQLISHRSPGWEGGQSRRLAGFSSQVTCLTLSLAPQPLCSSITFPPSWTRRRSLSKDTFTK